jgi:hypothetical protein
MSLCCHKVAYYFMVMDEEAEQAAAPAKDETAE